MSWPYPSSLWHRRKHAMIIHDETHWFTTKYIKLWVHNLLYTSISTMCSPKRISLIIKSVNASSFKCAPFGGVHRHSHVFITYSELLVGMVVVGGNNQKTRAISAFQLLIILRLIRVIQIAETQFSWFASLVGSYDRLASWCTYLALLAKNWRDPVRLMGKWKRSLVGSSCYLCCVCWGRRRNHVRTYMLLTPMTIPHRSMGPPTNKYSRSDHQECLEAFMHAAFESDVRPYVLCL